jgi:hypothetical protein
MKDVEQYLKAVRVAAPSEGLDRRMDDMFAHHAGARWRKTAAWSMLAALTMAGATATLVVVLSRPPLLPVQPLVYRIEAQGLMRELLLTPSARNELPPRLVLRTSTQ